jgi:hypothetical protein
MKFIGKVHVVSVVTFLPGELKPQKIGPILETAKSPSEWGNDPHTTVEYSVRQDLWVPPFSLGPNTFPPSAPVTALSPAPGPTSLYVIGLDNEGLGRGKVHTKFFPDQAHGGQWSDWFPLGDNIVATDGTARSPANRLPPVSGWGSIDQSCLTCGKKQIFATYPD